MSKHTTDNNSDLFRCHNCGAFFKSSVCPICKTPYSGKPYTNDTIHNKIPIKDSSKGSKLKRAIPIIAFFLIAGGIAVWHFIPSDTPAKNNPGLFASADDKISTVPFPENGTFTPFFKDRECTDFVLINERPTAMYIRFKQNNNCEFELFIRENSTASFSVPAGEYDVFIAAGDADEWRGMDARFGSKTQYIVDNSLEIPDNGLNLTLQNGTSRFGDLVQSSKFDFDK